MEVTSSSCTAGLLRVGRFPIATALLAMLLVVAVSGCAALGAAVGTAAVLQGAGYQNVSVNIATGAGQPAGGLVRVSYSRGPSGNDQRDAEHAERIVWHTLRYHFGALVIVKDGGGCAGPVCVSESGVIARATYSHLAARFGPRPRGLEAAGAADAIRFPDWAMALAIGVAVAVTAAVAAVLALIMRSPGRR